MNKVSKSCVTKINNEKEIINLGMNIQGSMCERKWKERRNGRVKILTF